MNAASAPLSEIVSRARSAAGLTQEQFAVKAGITAKTLRAIESGAGGRPQKRTLRCLASALGVDVADLHDHDGTPGFDAQGENENDGPTPQPLPGDGNPGGEANGG